MHITKVNETSPLLNDVIELGKKNSSTLGFLPKGAYKVHASENRIIAIVDKEEHLLGYLFYSVSKRKNIAYIVQLCIDSNYRRKGISHKLFNELLKETKSIYRGIRVRCRRDYEASKVWPKLGFIAVNDMPGRSKSGSELTVWWYDFGSPDLFSFDNIRDLSKDQVIIDANIFYSLMNKNSIFHRESSLLLSDWLIEEIEICLTSEIYNEINRNNEKDKREESRAYAKRFPNVLEEGQKLSEFYNDLKLVFPSFTSQSGESDLRHLAHAIASDIRFFVTRDKKILRKSNHLFSKFGVLVLRPASLIIHFDELINGSSYQPEKLEGSYLISTRVGRECISEIENCFYSGKEEKKNKFESLLNDCLLSPNINDTNVVKTQDEFLALYSFNRNHDSLLDIPLFRISKSALSSTISFHVLNQAVQTAAKESRSLVVVSDKYLSEKIEVALLYSGFHFIKNKWIKINVKGILESKEVLLQLELIKQIALKFYLDIDDFVINIVGLLKSDDDLKKYKIERMLWPLKLMDINIPSYIVPIKPHWAMNLFDAQIARYDLFGSDPSLILNYENIYYKSAHQKFISAPSRILWYVSKDSRGYSDVMSLKASSYIDGVFMGKPRTLYKQFNRLGIYRFRDVLNISNFEEKKEIMAFKFSGTEIFSAPINISSLRDYWENNLHKNFNIQGPLKISSQIFLNFYKSGMCI